MKLSSTQVDLSHLRPRCPICESRHIHHIATAVHKGVSLPYSHCRDCSVMFQNPTMPPEHLGEFYSTVYPEIYKRHKNDDLIATQGKRAALMVEYIAQWTEQPSTVLEIGCSTGMLGRAVLSRFPGSRYFGVELDETLAAIARQSFPVAKTANDHGQRVFDLILMSHSLEHFFDPVAYVRQLVGMLAPDGRIIVEVPNGNVGNGFEIAHPIIFTTLALATLTSRVGLSFLHSSEHNSFRGPARRPLYLSATFGTNGKSVVALPPAMLKWKVASRSGRKILLRNIACRLIGRDVVVLV